MQTFAEGSAAAKRLKNAALHNVILVLSSDEIDQ